MADNKVYEIVRDNLLKQLEENGGRWCCPWNCNVKFAKPYFSEPDEYYKGINVLLNRPSEYVTMKMVQDMQAEGKDISIRKGCHMHSIYYYNFVEQKDKEGNPVLDDKGNPVKKPFFRFYKVFALDDVIGLESRVPYESHEHTLDEKMEKAQQHIKLYCELNGIDVQVVKGGTSAYFRPANNSITLPDISQYKNPYEYFSTVFHELSHAIDHKLHLSTGINEKVKIDNYSAGELLAEISAAMMCQQYDIPDTETFENSVSYIDGWSKKIKDERASFIVSVASKSWQAVEELVSSVEKEIARREAEQCNEIAVQAREGIINVFVNSDGDFEYNIYKQDSSTGKIKLYDGGILDYSEEGIKNVFEALTDILDGLGIEKENITPVDMDDLESVLDGDMEYDEVFR